MVYLNTLDAGICQRIDQLKYSAAVMRLTSFDNSNALSPSHKYQAVLMFGGSFWRCFVKSEFELHGSGGGLASDLILSA